VPSAPGACGCGVSSQVTPRWKLRELGTDQLTAMETQLKTEISKTKDEVKAAEAKYKDMLDKMRARSVEVAAKSENLTSDMKNRSTQLEAERAGLRAAIADADAKALQYGEGILKARKELEALRGQWEQKALIARNCRDCPKSSLFLLSSSAGVVHPGADLKFAALPAESTLLSLLRRGGHQQLGVDHELLVRNVEGLQEQLGEAKQALQKATTTGVASQGNLLKQTDAAAHKHKLLATRLANEVYEQDAELKRLKATLQKAGLYGDLQASKLKGLEGDAKATRSKLKQLEEAMAKCKCT